MRVKFFVVPGLDPAGAEAEVNALLARHRIVSIDRELVARSEGIFWLLAITYVESMIRRQVGRPRAIPA